MRLRILSMFPVVVAVATLPAPSARAQAGKAEPAPAPAGEFTFPKKVVEAMRREVEARKKEQEAIFTKARAAPPFVPEPVAAQAPMVFFQGPFNIQSEPFDNPPPVMIGQVIQGQRARVVVNPGVNQHWSTQIRPILRVEYQFLRMVCNPTKEQRQPIARAGLAALDDAAKKYVEWQTTRNRVVQMVTGKVVNTPGQNVIPDPRKIIQDALINAAKENLPPEQQERYRKELEARLEVQKQAAIMGLVAKLDQLLLLSAEQREAILVSLSTRWNAPWSAVLQHSSVDQQYFPMIPDEYIVSSLNADQKSVWGQSGKITLNPSISLGTRIDDGPLDDEFPDEAVTKPATEK